MSGIFCLAMPKIITSSDLDDVKSRIIKVDGNLNYALRRIKSIEESLSALTVLVRALIVIASLTLLIFLIYLCVAHFKSKPRHGSKKISMQDLASIIERKAYVRTEELFADVHLDLPPHIIKLNKGLTEVYYIAFQIASCGFDSPQLPIMAISKIAERNDILCGSMLTSDVSIPAQIKPMVSTIQEAMKSGSPFSLTSTLRPNLSDNIYDDLVEQKNVMQEILKWLDDSKELLTLNINSQA